MGSNCLLDTGISDDSHSIKRQCNSSRGWTRQDDRGLQLKKVKRLTEPEKGHCSPEEFKNCQIQKSQYPSLSGSCNVNHYPGTTTQELLTLAGPIVSLTSTYTRARHQRVSLPQSACCHHVLSQTLRDAKASKAILEEFLLAFPGLLLPAKYSLTRHEDLASILSPSKTP